MHKHLPTVERGVRDRLFFAHDKNVQSTITSAAQNSMVMLGLTRDLGTSGQRHCVQWPRIKWHHTQARALLIRGMQLIAIILVSHCYPNHITPHVNYNMTMSDTI